MRLLPLFMISAAAMALTTGCTMTETPSPDLTQADTSSPNAQAAAPLTSPVAPRIDHEITQI